MTVKDVTKNSCDPKFRTWKNGFMLKPNFFTTRIRNQHLTRSAGFTGISGPMPTFGICPQIPGNSFQDFLNRIEFQM